MNKFSLLTGDTPQIPSKGMKKVFYGNNRDDLFNGIVQSIKDKDRSILILPYKEALPSNMVFCWAEVYYEKIPDFSGFDIFLHSCDRYVNNKGEYISLEEILITILFKDVKDITISISDTTFRANERVFNDDWKKIQINSDWEKFDRPIRTSFTGRISGRLF